MVVIHLSLLARVAGLALVVTFFQKRFRPREMAISTCVTAGVNSTPHRMRSCTQDFFSHAWPLSQELTRAQESSLGVSPKKSFHRHLHAMFSLLLTPARRPAIPHQHPHAPQQGPGHHGQDPNTRTPKWEEQYGRLAINSPLTRKDPTYR